MKYYLIKARDEADVKWVCEKAYRFIYPFGFMPICVELTKEELKFLQEESLNYDSDFILAKKLRGVLE